MATPAIKKTYTAPCTEGQLPAHHKGPNPGDGFINPWPSAGRVQGFKDFARVLLEWDRSGSAPPPKDQRLKVEAPDMGRIISVNEGKEEGTRGLLTWLGHAALLMSYPGLNVLFDPCFSNRCSPVQFMGPSRVIPPPCNIEDLPPVDLVVISHNHYDHLDLATIKKLAKPHTWFFVPLGNKAWFTSIGIDNVFECDWWDEYEFTVEKGGKEVKATIGRTRIACTPCQHFTGRSLTDRNQTLWSSWVVKGNNTSFFFGGDTGYRTVPSNDADLSQLPVCPAFKEIGEKYGPFDMAAIPIGAYSPRWFMSTVHCSPEDAVCVHQDVRSRHSIGMHWGTFTLTDEPYFEPRERLKKALAEKGLPDTEFHTLTVGESVKM
ncbi:hypothetical protein HK104_002493 [Borealophlyctis nickersoniae]|nr:hypothetical protein HK104_002493 [Borealophlyctis nickersoniae]